MDPVSAGSPANYQVEQWIRKGRKRTLRQAGFRVNYLSATGSVDLLLAGKPTFPLGGIILVSASVLSATGIPLDGNRDVVVATEGVIRIPPNARTIIVQG